MSQEILQTGLQRSNVPLLANAIELGACAILKVAGNSIANTVDDKPLNAAFLHSALAAKIQSLVVINNKTGS